ncbi:DNA primase [Cytobacillus firmus]|uniref:DNA primase n=1 Tax=Cytobacillus firmus TaxID=1399 RepID=UPI0018CEB39B|nr:DNA primase [Cytobacillus firmus]MBG9448622.1 DNA primase [Cytobacillus firmus]MBY6051179.1 DNA primase [Cytobacillus firmus]URT69823.1 DNA primase [Cytobacillus firmus]WHY33118.1 DNA primase [Cytobacillus firmus]WHY60733.1 DNA primase [Cytobacillus firmus]
MAERIAEEKVNEIRQAVDIVDVIGDYIQLNKQGRNYFGLCPFHGENTPSFSVSPEKQIYHCFGCGAGGNAFSFIMDLEGYSFQEAALKLAEKGNIKLEIDASAASAKSMPVDIQQMMEAHELLRKFYHHLLVNTKDGQHALEYLLNRGFTMESIEKFQIGYSLKSWDFVFKFLTKRKFPEGVMERAGLIIKREKDGNYFDRFRDRIMFPIFDRSGNTIAFSGRSLGADEPKYLNSPETAIFNKSKTLYNFHLARPQIKKLQRAVLFEGFADVIAADRAGVGNGVGTMGTALTEEHVASLRRNVQSITICYDSDNAGIEAAYRAANLLTEAGCQIRVALMPDGYDPDDYIKEYGEEKFRHDVIESSITFMAFKLLYLRRGKRLQNEGDRLLYIEEVLKEISRLDKAVERDHYLRQMANEFSLSLEALKEQQKQVYYTEKRKSSQKGKGAFEPQKRLQTPKRADSLKPAFHTAERRLIAHMLRNSDIAFKVQDMLQGNTFNIDEHQAIITYLLGFYEKGHTPDPSAFINFINDEKLKRIVVDIEMMSINDEISEQELSDYLKQVLNYQKMLKIKEKLNEEKEAERQKDYAKAALIAMEILHLRKSL